MLERTFFVTLKLQEDGVSDNRGFTNDPNSPFKNTFGLISSSSDHKRNKVHYTSNCCELS